MREKLTVDSPFFGAFSDSIPKATRDVSVHFFIHSFIIRDNALAVRASSKLY